MSIYTYFFSFGVKEYIEIIFAYVFSLHSDSLSILITISPLIMSKLFLASFSCGNKFILSHKS